MTNDKNTPIDTTDVIQTPLNVAATDATVTNVGSITTSTVAATTSTILPAGNAADETTRRSLFGGTEDDFSALRTVRHHELWQIDNGVLLMRSSR
ncbi:hypothetical protein F2Q70_00025505 [Brassica cretica]|uniref:Uncharacterized protein n=1 Tax=Brassica cretica TaxID=69181 RepID=A0A8S9L8N0_BRACR|nr:hypothetical protein F2Q70_00025505 [Brassica cretica]